MFSMLMYREMGGLLRLWICWLVFLAVLSMQGFGAGGGRVFRASAALLIELKVPWAMLIGLTFTGIRCKAQRKGTVFSNAIVGT
jgi:hypothetical protein